MVVRVQRYPAQSWPLGDLWDFEHGIDDLFGSFLNVPTVMPRLRTYPALDVAEYPEETVVVAEIPGARKEDVKVSVQGDVLTISGVRKGHDDSTGNSWLYNEIRTGEFSRSIELPHAVEAGKISAELNNGVLRVVLPKAEDAKAREIHIR
jgi:HSP20 family protein